MSTSPRAKNGALTKVRSQVAIKVPDWPQACVSETTSQDNSLVGLASMRSVGSARSLTSVSSRGNSSNKLTKRGQNSGSMAMRLETARKRTDAALIIQRTWYRWYVSAARKRRMDAARSIQHLWRGRAMMVIAAKELEFRRWVRQRRASLRGQWSRLLRRIQLRIMWANATIAAAKNVWVWRRRLIERRRRRHATQLQRWWRRLTYDLLTRARVLLCRENLELRRLEHLLRVTLFKQFCLSLPAVVARGYEVLDCGLVLTLDRWCSKHRLPLELTPRLQRAADEMAADATRNERLAAAAHCSATESKHSHAPLSTIGGTKLVGSVAQQPRVWESPHTALPPPTVNAASPPPPPCKVPQRPMSGGVSRPVLGRFTVRTPSAGRRIRSRFDLPMTTPFGPPATSATRHVF